MWHARSGTRVCIACGGTKRGRLLRANAQRRRRSVERASTHWLPASPLESRGRGDSRGDVACPERDPRLYRLRRYEAWAPSKGERPKKAAEPADKPGSVVDSHSSRRYVTAALKQPTRIQRGPRQWIPIWSCSRWGLPCRSVTGLAVRSYRTISPLPAPRHPFAASERAWRCEASLARFSGGKGVTRDVGGIFLLHFPSACAAQALPGTLPYGARTFLGTLASDATVWPTPPGRILRYRCRAERRGDFKLAIAL
ncbi:hypothetical protein XACJK2_330017 [Xanthomonas citri pv. citri]|nr:hypothetical protein XACJK2_330017 [Xanthomonas citri pv. citri]